ncbi:hypothetical protein FS837_002795 [Tulasnella sp. UAMH 9824]|nr:hypothetical protein FS837_002795 [Tulasnella sp. UAMH 9824]
MKCHGQEIVEFQIMKWALPSHFEIGHLLGLDGEEEIIKIKKSNFKLISMQHSAPRKSLNKKSTINHKVVPRKPASNLLPSKHAKRSPRRKLLITHQAKPASATTKTLLTKPTSSRNQPPAKAKQSKQAAPPHKYTNLQEIAKGNATAKPLSGSSGLDTEEEVEVSKGGCKPVKADWAFGQFDPSPSTNNRGKPIWVWRCHWCLVIRTSSRTLQVREYGKETLPRPKSSNFISHLKPEYCRIPEEALFENIGKEVPAASGSVAPVAGYEAQRKMIHDFTACRIITPARKFTKEGFQTAFVKGVIEDGLPFTFAYYRDLLASFGIVEPSSIVDHYHDTNRQYGLHYSAETDPDILAQEAELETEAKRSKGGGKGAAATAEDDYTYKESDENESDWEEEESRSTGASGNLNPLEKAIDVYITQMTEGKWGKKLNEARKCQAKLAMSFHEWEAVSQLCKVLEVYQDATLDLSCSDLPTLLMVLPIYKQVKSALEKGIEATRETESGVVSIAEEAYQAALTKLTKYISAACESPLHLVATVVNRESKTLSSTSHHASHLV